MTNTIKPISSSVPDAYQSGTSKNIYFNKNISSHRKCFPQYSDHIARYYQRISDIFETNESDKSDVERQSVIKTPELPAFKAKTTYKTVIEDVKDLEKKYRKMNEDEERRRPRTDLDHYRPDAVLHNSKHPDQFKKLSSQEADTYDSSFDKLYSRTIQLYRDAATPPSTNSKVIKHSAQDKSSISINPARYLAANLKTDLYMYTTRPSRIPTNTMEKPALIQPTHDREDSCLNISCGLKRRYTNRETRLARQMLEHIKTEQKWTSNVDRPFVLGI